MQARYVMAGLLWLVCVVDATAQTAVTTSGNTTGTVPVFNGTVTASGATTVDIKDSPISVLNGNVGIGTTSPPQYALEVNGNTVIDNGNTLGLSSAINCGSGGATCSYMNALGNSGNFGYIELQGYYAGIGYNVPLAFNPIGGNVGIGTTAPTGLLDVNSVGGLVVSGVNLDQHGSYSLAPLQNSGKLLEGWNLNAGAGEIDLISNRGGGGLGGFAFYDYSNSGVLTSLLTLVGSGNVGIGTTNPGAKLEVSGNIKLTANSGSSITFPDGSVQTVAYTGVTCGADYAEAVDVTGDRTKYEPGDILVLDPHVPGKFLKSNQAYSTLVAGIYSTKPGFVGRKQPVTPETNATEVPMAMVGRVPTKVTTENGSIQVGDLLVASSTVGYAMKGTDRSRLTGAVIGKAMDTLDTGSGLIEVLVTLQ